MSLIHDGDRRAIQPKPQDLVQAKKSFAKPLFSARLILRRMIDRFQRGTQTVTTAPLAIPSGNFDRCVFGLAQLVLAGQLMLRRPALIKAALIPASIFAILCGLLGYAEYGEGGVWGTVKHIYLALVAAAPISPILFSRSYARLAARARKEAGFSSRDPYLRGLKAACKETVLQLVVVGAGLAPLYLILGILPLSTVSIAIISAAWTLHWIFIESLDSSRTLPANSTNPQGITPSKVQEETSSSSMSSARPDTAIELAHPWYQRFFAPNLRKPWSVFVPPFAAWGRLLAHMTQRWRGEVAVAEAHPWMAAGFASGVALILAIPGINLFFRPIVVVAASLLQAKLEPTDRSILPKGNEPPESIGPPKPS